MAASGVDLASRCGRFGKEHRGQLAASPGCGPVRAAAGKPSGRSAVVRIRRLEPGKGGCAR
jgi:hypothetical protein